MSDLATIFNPLSRPVQYTSDGLSLGGGLQVLADLSDPACALAIDHGFLVVLEAVEQIDIPSAVPVPPVSAAAAMSNSQEAPVVAAIGPDESNEGVAVTGESSTQAKEN